jgi:coenzyme F420-reducing hydrogenase beta subunit
MSKKIFAAINKNESIRKKCSSGAVFYELALNTISDGGVVFGAAFDKAFNVAHTFADKIEEIEPLLTSKYTQSRIGNSYSRAKEFLEYGRKVLFVGTPCQISGFKSFLGKDYDNLVCVDFICHGVPSPGVFSEYIKRISEGKKIKKINFRDKTHGWLNYSLRIDFEGGEYYSKDLTEDLFMKGFLQDIILRPSCYKCHFRGDSRDSDLTLADYWGVNRDIPELFDDKGASLVITHTEKGETTLEEVSDKLYLREAYFELALSHNTSYFKSVSKPEKRAVFFRNGIDGFSLLEKLTKKPLLQTIIKKSKSAVKTLLGKNK